MRSLNPEEEQVLGKAKDKTIIFPLEEEKIDKLTKSPEFQIPSRMEGGSPPIM